MRKLFRQLENDGKNYNNCTVGQTPLHKTTIGIFLAIWPKAYCSKKGENKNIGNNNKVSRILWGL